MKTILIASLILFTNLAHAAIAPWGERVRQMTAVLNDQATLDNFHKLAGYHGSDGRIESVAYVSNEADQAIYRVSSGQCAEDIVLTFKATGLVGPARIEVNHVNPVQCK